MKVSNAVRAVMWVLLTLSLMAAPVRSAWAGRVCYPNNPQMPSAGTTCYDTGSPGGSTEHCYPNNPSMPSAGTTCTGGGGSGGSSGGSARGGYRIPPGVHCSRIEVLTTACYFRSLRGWERVRQVRGEVAQAVAAGRCDEAVQLAMSIEDFQTAAQARTACRPMAAGQNANPGPAPAPTK